MRYFLFITAVLVAFACGSKQNDHGKSPEDNGLVPPPTARHTFDQRDHWVVDTMECGTTPTSLPAGLEFRLDQDYLTRVEEVSRDALEVCKIGKVYKRNVSTFGNYDARYWEKAEFASAGAKKTCSSLVNGAPPEPTTSQTLPASSEIGTVEIQLVGDEVVIGFTGLSDCPGQTLVFHAKRSPVHDRPASRRFAAARGESLVQSRRRSVGRLRRRY